MMMLKKAGVDARAVCRVTGHKNAKISDTYKPSDFEQRVMAKAIDGAASTDTASQAVAAHEQVVTCSSQASGNESEQSTAMPSFTFNGSTCNHLTINVQGVPRQKKQESRLKLKQKVK